MTVVADGAVTEFDAFDVDVVDATGAGDSFVAGLIDRWIAGSDSGDDPHAASAPASPTASGSRPRSPR